MAKLILFLTLLPTLLALPVTLPPQLRSCTSCPPPSTCQPFLSTTICLPPQSIRQATPEGGLTGDACEATTDCASGRGCGRLQNDGSIASCPSEQDACFCFPTDFDQCKASGECTPGEVCAQEANGNLQLCVAKTSPLLEEAAASDEPIVDVDVPLQTPDKKPEQKPEVVPIPPVTTPPPEEAMETPATTAPPTVMVTPAAAPVTEESAPTESAPPTAPVEKPTDMVDSTDDATEDSTDEKAVPPMKDTESAAKGHDDHEGHDHGDHEGHDHGDHEGHDHSEHEGDDDHSGHDHGDHEGHDHSKHDGDDDHSGHDHEEPTSSEEEGASVGDIDPTETATADEDATADSADENDSDSDNEENEEEICIGAHHLDEFSGHELVYDTHRRAKVLCDDNGSCATPGHIVHWMGNAMMMKSYCQVVGQCQVRSMKVNSPRWSRQLRVNSLTQGLKFTAFAARYETIWEERVLTNVVRVGL